jgi:DNA repair exonuclease SbcCD ATPase subunit
MTNRTTRFEWCGVLLLMVSLLVTALWAQSDEGTEVASRIRFTREQFLELTQKMTDVADMVEETEPETAQVLRQAVSQAEKAFTADDMDRIAQLLGEGLLGAAGSGQEEVLAELRSLLETLEHGQVDPDERREQIKKWEERLEQLDAFYEKQLELENQSRLDANAEAVNDQLKTMKENLESLIAEQEALLAQTQSDEAHKAMAGSESIAEVLDGVRQADGYQEMVSKAIENVGTDQLPALGGVQESAAEDLRKLAEAAEALAENDALMEKIAQAGGDSQSPSNAADKLRSAARELDASGEALGKPDSQSALDSQANARADIQDAAEELEKLLDAALKDTPVGDMQSEQEGLASKARDLADAAKELQDASGAPVSSENAERASAAMEKASENIGQGQLSRAEQNQEEALRQLRDENRKLAQLEQRLKELQERPIERQQADQEQLSEQVAKAAMEMSESQDGKGPTPGSESTGKARESMKDASQSLEQAKQGDAASSSRSSSKANDEQDEALDELEKARRDLAEAIEEERRRLEQEQLAKIEQLLQDALDSQRKLTQATIKIHEENPDNQFSRAGQLKLGEIAQSEREIQDDIAQVKTMLDEEGTSTVFPWALDQIHEDLGLIASRLESYLPDVPTQELQKDVEDLLQEMIDAVGDEIKRRSRGGGGGGGGGGEGGGGQTPLIPPAAELKMLRRLQLQVNSQTTRLDAMRDEMTEEQVAERAKTIAERQKQVLDLVGTMGRSPEAPEGEAPMRPDGEE